MENNIKRRDLAVAEIIGAILLLAMAVAAFSVIYINVLSDDGPGLDSYATIVGKMENGHPMFENQRGNGIGLDSKIYYYNYDQLIYTDIVNKIIESKDDNSVWNIGELLFSNYSEPGKEIEAKIFDSITDDMIWWGTLQKGGRLGQLGARWYFDENGGDIAYDSLNDNDGYLLPKLFGPRWNHIITYNKSISSLYFHGGNDYVYVKGDTISLNFIENISVEARVKFPEYNYITNLTFSSPFGLEPNIINVCNDIYAIAYRGKSPKQQGFIRTVNISSEGNIIDNIYNNSIMFDDTAAYWPKLCHVSDDIYTVVYSSETGINPRVDLKTLRITNNGTIGPLFSRNFAFSDKEVLDYDIIKISNNHTALVYRNNTDNKNPDIGMIKTLNFTNPNFITVDSTLKFDDKFNKNCYEPDIVQVSKNIYAIAYVNANGAGVLITVEITPDGVIHQINDSYIFDSINVTNYPDIKLVSNNTYVITYSGTNGGNVKGLLATVEIADDGSITKKVYDKLVYESVSCKFPKIISMVDDIFVVAFEGKNQDGWVVLCKINENGSIDDNLLSQFKFNIASKPYQGNTPDIIKLSDYFYAIVFNVGSQEGAAQEGHLRTFSLEDFLSPLKPINCGIIYKQDTWGIWLNKTMVVATMGNNIYSFKAPSNNNIISKTGWNHLILTYDQTTLKLICNDIEVISKPLAGFRINNPSKDIFIGKKFHGFIDNVFILEES